MDDLHKQMQAAALAIGKVEWGATAPLSMTGHLAYIGKSIRLTAEAFKQTGRQPMHGVFVEGSETVVGHTGTSPNSGAHACILAALWNQFVDEAAIDAKKGEA
jgi:hypothetical protein